MYIHVYVYIYELEIVNRAIGVHISSLKITQSRNQYYSITSSPVLGHVQVYVYIYMYIFMYIYIYIYIYMYIYIYVYIYIRIHIYVYIYVYMYACIQKYGKLARRISLITWWWSSWHTCIYKYISI